MNKQVERYPELYLGYLMCCALRQEEPQRIPENMEWKKVYRDAKRHSLVGMLYPAISKISDDLPKELFEKWKQDYNSGVLKELSFDVERERIFARFEQEKIFYLPLKGILLKKYYPKVGMRSFADHDILFHGEEDMDRVYDIMMEFGYSSEARNISHHDTYLKKPFYNFEMHRQLIDINIQEPAEVEYFRGIWKRAIPVSKGNKGNKRSYEMQMTKEDFLIYFFWHYYKHDSHAGSGLRTLTDLYEFLSVEKTLDWDWINQELKKMNLLEFAEEKKNLSFVLFENQELSQQQLDSYRFTLGLATYGTRENSIRHYIQKEIEQIESKSNRVRLVYLRKRLLPGYSFMCIRNPILLKYPVLYPFYVIARLFLHSTQKKDVELEMKELRKQIKKDGL